MTWWAWLIVAYVVAFCVAILLLGSFFEAVGKRYPVPDAEENARPLGNVHVLPYDYPPKGGK